LLAFQCRLVFAVLPQIAHLDGAPYLLRQGNAQLVLEPLCFLAELFLELLYHACRACLGDAADSGEKRAPDRCDRPGAALPS
jgi:hypothetical protein